MTDTTPGTDVAYLRSTFAERMEYAKALAAAGELVPSGFREKNGSANPAKLLLVFETGAMLGLHPMAAVAGIDVIEGKATMSAQLMAGVVRGRGHRLRDVLTGTVEDGTASVTATLYRADDPTFAHVAVWDIDRARRANLFGKSMWQKYTENMLRSRAIAEVCRRAASDALNGIVYTPEELGANVNEDGDVIDGEIVEDGPGTGSPGDTGKRGHASETQVRTGPDKQRTPAGGSRPSPSRTVENSGAGRANPAPQKAVDLSEETAAAVAEYVERIAAEDDIERLRDLHGDASTHGLLATPTGDGRRLNDVFYQRRETILQAQEMPPALDGIEDDA